MSSSSFFCLLLRRLEIRLELRHLRLHRVQLPALLGGGTLSLGLRRLSVCELQFLRFDFLHCLLLR